jgi:uncharacterized protein (DUF1778 family)
MLERIELRINAKEKKLFDAAAKSQGITLSKWLRFAAWQIIDDHAGKIRLRALDE